jgi:hypothetical protein
MSALPSNPYAPPQAEDVPVFASPLPPGFRRFHLDPVSYPKLMSRWVLRAVGVYAAIGLPFLGVFCVMATLSPLSIVPGVLIVLAFVWGRAAKRPTEAIRAYELLVAPRILRRTTATAGPAEILRPEVTRIVETRDGLWLSSDAPPRALFVWRAVDGYADVRAELAAWRPIETLRGWEAWRVNRRWMRWQGHRDAVIGTALAEDTSLRQELELARAVSSTVHLHYPKAGTKRRGPWMTLVLWLVLIVMFLAIWQFLSPTDHPTHPRRAAPAPTSVEP